MTFKLRSITPAFLDAALKLFSGAVENVNLVAWFQAQHVAQWRASSDPRSTLSIPGVNAPGGA